MSSSKDAKQVWALGGTFLASVMLIMAGIWQALEGVAALQTDEFLHPRHGYTYRFSVETWGWINIVVGLFCIGVGAMLYTGKALYRKIAVVVVALSMVTSFLFLPYYTSWPILILAVDILVIWSLVNFKDPEAESWAQHDADQ